LNTSTPYDEGLTEYVVVFRLHYGEGIDNPGTHELYLGGKPSGDFRDVRFTDDRGVILPYWVESFGFEDYAIVWVKIPVKGPTTTIYIYYGNPDAEYEGDASKVFIFFDGFETLSEYWKGLYTCVGGMISNPAGFGIENGWLKFGGFDVCGVLYYDNPIDIPTSGVAFETLINLAYVPPNADLTLFGIYPSKDDLINGTNLIARTGVVSWDNHYWYIYTKSGDAVSNNYLYGGTAGVVRVSFRVGKSRTSLYFDWGEVVGTDRYLELPNQVYMVLVGSGADNWTMDYRFDWVGVRPYTYPEPQAVSVGVEELDPTTQPSYTAPTEGGGGVTAPTTPTTTTTYFSLNWLWLLVALASVLVIVKALFGALRRK
jgi:hypothetical protein